MPSSPDADLLGLAFLGDCQIQKDGAPDFLVARPLSVLRIHF